MKKKKVVKRRASHAAATHKAPASRETEKESVRREIREKEDLNQHPDKVRQLGEEHRENLDQAEKEIEEVLQKHGFAMQPEFKVQLRSWFTAQQPNIPPEMREGPGVV